MFNKIYAWVGKNVFTVITTIIIIFVGVFEYQKFTNPPELEQFSGSIQNHLVWSIKGECYFVRPHTTNTTYLIRVQDCDKK